MTDIIPATLDLEAVAPFDLPLTLDVLRRRPTHRAEVFVDGEYRRILPLDGQPRLIGARQIAPAQIAARALDGALSDTAQRELAATLERMLGLRVDLAPLQSVFAQDERLALLARHIVGMKPPRFDSLWTSFISIVPFQQVSLDAGIAVLNRLIERLGSQQSYDGRTYYGFPTTAQFLAADAETLRGCGLSAAKVRTLRAAAEAIERGDLTESEIEALSDDAALAMLTALPGIGPWSAHLILLRGFRRLSMFPPGDSGAARNLQRFFNMPPAEAAAEAKALLERLGPWRGYLYFLLLAQRLVS